MMPKGSFPPDQNYGIFGIIPKVVKDSSFLTKWQTLILLNTLFKLFSAIFVERLKAVLSRMSDCTRNTSNIIQPATQNNLPDLVVLEDFDKTFDSLSFGFINTILKIFGFGPFFSSWINILLENTPGEYVTSLNIVNGHVTDRFEIARGCPH